MPKSNLLAFDPTSRNLFVSLGEAFRGSVNPELPSSAACQGQLFLSATISGKAKKSTWKVFESVSDLQGAKQRIGLPNASRIQEKWVELFGEKNGDGRYEVSNNIVKVVTTDTEDFPTLPTLGVVSQLMDSASPPAPVRPPTARVALEKAGGPNQYCLLRTVGAIAVPKASQDQSQVEFSLPECTLVRIGRRSTYEGGLPASTMTLSLDDFAETLVPIEIYSLVGLGQADAEYTLLSTAGAAAQPVQASATTPYGTFTDVDGGLLQGGSAKFKLSRDWDKDDDPQVTYRFGSPMPALGDAADLFPNVDNGEAFEVGSESIHPTLPKLVYSAAGPSSRIIRDVKDDGGSVTDAIVIQSVQDVMLAVSGVAGSLGTPASRGGGEARGLIGRILQSSKHRSASSTYVAPSDWFAVPSQFACPSPAFLTGLKKDLRRVSVDTIDHLNAVARPPPPAGTAQPSPVADPSLTQLLDPEFAAKLLLDSIAKEIAQDFAREGQALNGRTVEMDGVKIPELFARSYVTSECGRPSLSVENSDSIVFTYNVTDTSALTLLFGGVERGGGAVVSRGLVVVVQVEVRCNWLEE